MNEDIETDLLLKADALFDLLLIELNVLFLGDISSLILESVLSYVRCLREGTDSCRRELRKLEGILLDLLPFIKCREPYIVGIRYGCNLLLNFLVFGISSSLEKLPVISKRRFCGIVLFDEESDLIKLGKLLLGESEMLLVLLLKFRLAA